MNDRIFTGHFGSTLYGLRHVGSDDDVKAVYAPNQWNLALDTYKDAIEKKENGGDFGLYSVQKFLKLLNKSDTVSVDMIHTPPSMYIDSTFLWSNLRQCRADIYSKQSTGMLGYIKTQTSKYGHKVQRLEEVRHLLNCCVNISPDIKVYETSIYGYVKQQGYKFISVNPRKGDVLENIDVCGSRIQTNTSLEHFVSLLKKKVDSYGERANKGSIEGGDWKSLSHAYRVLIQMEEIVDTRDLIFPLVKAPEIMEIKMGRVSQGMAVGRIDEKYDVLMEKLKSSDLPEYPNIGNMQAHVMNYYFGG